MALTFHTRADEAEAAAREVRSVGRRAFVGGGDLADPEVADRLLAGVGASLADWTSLWPMPGCGLRTR